MSILVHYPTPDNATSICTEPNEDEDDSAGAMERKEGILSVLSLDDGNDGNVNRCRRKRKRIIIPIVCNLLRIERALAELRKLQNEPNSSGEVVCEGDREDELGLRVRLHCKISSIHELPSDVSLVYHWDISELLEDETWKQSARVLRNRMHDVVKDAVTIEELASLEKQLDILHWHNKLCYSDSRLPLDMLSYAFQFLQPEELKVMRCVSRLWFEVAQTRLKNSRPSSLPPLYSLERMKRRKVIKIDRRWPPNGW